MVDISSPDFNFIVEDTLKGIFSLLAENKLRCGIMQNSAISFSFVTDADESRLSKVKQAFESLGLHCKVQTELELLTVYNGVQTRTNEITSGKKIKMQQSIGKTVHFVLENA